MAENPHLQPVVINDAEVHNVVDADVSGSVVQAQAITGGVHFHQYERRLAPPGVGLPYRFGAFPPRAGSFRTRVAAGLVAELLTADGGPSAGVLSGLGGVGKTQLAVDYAETVWARGEVDLLVWITAGSREAIVSSYARLAADLLGVEDDNVDYGVQRLFGWLAVAGVRWLVVLDDVQSPSDLSGLWPPPVAPRGRVLVTTRRWDAALRGHGRQLLEVGVFTEAEACGYVRDTVAGHQHLMDGADELAAELGFLPLALAQATAFMIDRQITCLDYRVRLADRRRSLASLLPEAEGLPDEHRATVMATWSISVEQADRLVPAGLARPLLEMAGFLDANGVPPEVFSSAAVLGWLGERVGHGVGAEEAFDGLSCLRRLSLLAWEPDSPHRAVRVHALVQRVIRDNLPRERLQVAARVAADALMQIWPDIERDTELGQALRANARALIEASGEHLWHPDAHMVLFRTGRSLGESGQVTQARNYYRRLHETATWRLGADHPHTLTTRHWYAHWCGEAGDQAGAAAAFEELLTDDLRVRGADHLHTLATRLDLAYRRGKAGDPAGAAAAFEKLLTDYLRVLGAEHPHTLTIRHQLANRRGRAGDPIEAASAFEKLLTDRVRMLGADHFKTLFTRHRLAYWRGKAGDPAGALTAFEELLTDDLRVLGADHPHTLFTRHQLAYWRGKAGDPAGAVTAFEELLTDDLRVLGADHPDTLTTQHQLIYWTHQAGGGGPA